MSDKQIRDDLAKQRDSGLSMDLEALFVPPPTANPRTSQKRKRDSPENKNDTSRSPLPSAAVESRTAVRENDGAEFHPEFGGTSEAECDSDKFAANVSRVQCFEEFLKRLQGALPHLAEHEKHRPRCSECENQVQADLFCQSCMDFYCKKCHLDISTCDQHRKSTWNSTFGCTKFHTSFPHSFENDPRTFDVNTAHTLCICETPDPTHRMDEVFDCFSEDFRFSTLRLHWCTACSCSMSAALSLPPGYLLIPTYSTRQAHILISLEACEWICAFPEITLRKLKSKIDEKNDSNHKMDIADLALCKYGFMQLKNYLQDELETCPCCFCPRRLRPYAFVMIQDYTNLKRSNVGSNAEIPAIKTQLGTGMMVCLIDKR